jgi:hypothetical protein
MAKKFGEQEMWALDFPFEKLATHRQRTRFEWINQSD